MTNGDYLTTTNPTITTQADFVGWLAEHTKNPELMWLLAHALDGVIWGRFEHGRLITSHEADGTLPALDFDTLIQCRIFGATAEVMLWKNGTHVWQQTVLTDSAEFIDEEQMLWGDHGKDIGQGFTLLSDGSQQLHHAVPIEMSQLSFNRTPVHRPVRLKVRHLLSEDTQTGAVFIRASRLVNLYAVPVEGAKQ